MHAESIRVNGGIGFSISSPNLEIKTVESGLISVSDHRTHGLGILAEKRLVEILGTIKEELNLRKSVSIEISGEAYAHHSFGTGTAIRLASIEGLLKLNSITLSDDELVALSGRGGTSGIGINTYFNGGLVLDLGTNNNGEAFKPSSQSQNHKEPLLFQQLAMPEWDIGVCIPQHIPPLSEQQEKEFFDKTCPIPESEAHKAMYHAVAGVYAAAKEVDKPAFESSIKALQKCAWKKAERNEHGKPLADLEDRLYQFGATTVGMSSLGPSLFFFTEDMDATIKLMKTELPNCEFIKTQPSNTGRKISYA